MAYDPDLHHRRSIRLRNYNYSARGAYYVTVCTHRRVCWFGEVETTETGVTWVRLNSCGVLVHEAWLRLPQEFGVELDDYVVMPNHLHGIFVLPGAEASVPDIVGAYKSRTAVDYGRHVRHDGWVPYERHFWHRNYYEHVIRDEDDLERIRRYIAENLTCWAEDKLNPINPLRKHP